jgi:hypothetical protein
MARPTVWEPLLYTAQAGINSHDYFQSIVCEEGVAIHEDGGGICKYYVPKLYFRFVKKINDTQECQPVFIQMLGTEVIFSAVSCVVDKSQFAFEINLSQFSCLFCKLEGRRWLRCICLHQSCM